MFLQENSNAFILAGLQLVAQIKCVDQGITADGTHQGETQTGKNINHKYTADTKYSQW